MQRAIYPEATIFTSIGSYNLGSFVRSITVKKSVKTPVHSCQVVLDTTLEGDSRLNALTADKGAFIRRMLKKNMVIAVKIDSTSKKYKFVGLIDQIVEQIQGADRNTGRQITINCSALLPKILIRDNIINAPQLKVLFEKQLAKNDPLLYRAEFFSWVRGLNIEGDKAKISTKTSEVIEKILDNTIATNTTILEFNGLAGDITPKSFLGADRKAVDYDKKPVWDFNYLTNEMLYDVNLSRYSGTILNYIHSALDMEFYEVFFDATTATNGIPLCKMIIRPKPFTYQNVNKGTDSWFLWEKLETQAINRSVVSNEVLSQSDYEVKNVFQVYFEKSLIASSGGTASKFGLQFPVVNIESIKKYGLRELTLKSTVANFDQVYSEYNEAMDGKKTDVHFENTKGGIGLIEYIQEKRDKIVEWYAFPHYESGQITTIGANFNIGEKLYFQDRIYVDEESGQEHEGVEYYIEETLDQFSYPQTWRTTLSVSRGAPKDFVPKWFAQNQSKFIRINISYDSLKDKTKLIDGINLEQLSTVERTA